MTESFFKQNRYELKYLVNNNFTLKNNLNNLNNFNILKINEPNKINNIYFDTPQFKFYRSHIEGNFSRFKIRIRWYEESNFNPDIYFLEVKFKYNQKVFKFKEKIKGYKINDFLNYNFQNIIKDIIFKKLNFVIEQEITPSLINSYKRNYFIISNNKKNRVTLDYDMRYGLRNFENLQTFNSNEVVEHKIENINMINSLQLNKVTKTSYSKYVFGLSKFYNI